MKQVSWVLIAAATATALLSSPLTVEAAVRPLADGAVQLYCADKNDQAHLKKVRLQTPVRLDALDPEEKPRLLFGYAPEGDGDRFTGRIRAQVTVSSSTGGKQKLGRIKTLQNTANGEALREKEFEVELFDGDLLEWKLRFSKFARLNAGDCFALFAGLASPAQNCGPYPEWRDSPYVLPYAVGAKLVVSQGNCSIGSHHSDARHAYDFAMPIGTEVVAARAGRVVAVDDSAPDGTGRFADDNAIVVEHTDGTLASYVHIRQGGASVAFGESVVQGQTIALSGDAGHTGGLPHLHFQVTTCPNRRDCGTEPVAFRNTSPNPGGLEVGRAYKAE